MQETPILLGALVCETLSWMTLSWSAIHVVQISTKGMKKELNIEIRGMNTNLRELIIGKKNTL